jgi:2'-5' RNA ligase
VAELDHRTPSARLFVAVWPPAAVLDELERLPRPDEAGVRWTARPTWHVTLRFLGDAGVAEAAGALAGLAADASVATLGPAVSRLGRDVICLPCTGLDALAGAATAATASVGVPPDPRPFNGHLTLARLRRRGACRLAGTPFSASFAVDEVHLVRSTLTPHGPRYETLVTRPLG